jgi:hypothetical protein
MLQIFINKIAIDFKQWHIKSLLGNDRETNN